MSFEAINFPAFRNGDSAEDFANLVNDLKRPGGEIVIVPFEDFTLPDEIVMGGITEVSGITLRYVELFGGALEHFHGIRPTTWSAVESPEAPQMTPFSMALQLTFTEQAE